jgi:hypothetical protein
MIQPYVIGEIETSIKLMSFEGFPHSKSLDAAYDYS